MHSSVPRINSRSPEWWSWFHLPSLFNRKGEIKFKTNSCSKFASSSSVGHSPSSLVTISPVKKTLHHKKMTKKNLTDMLYRQAICLQDSSLTERRPCLLCLGQGDGVSDGPWLSNHDIQNTLWCNYNYSSSPQLASVAEQQHAKEVFRRRKDSSRKQLNASSSTNNFIRIEFDFLFLKDWADFGSCSSGPPPPFLHPPP